MAFKRAASLAMLQMGLGLTLCKSVVENGAHKTSCVDLQISFYFPGGFIPWMFFALAFSHTYIYLYDHCRVLRSIPHCEFSRMQ
eukprot:5443632-Amphidinium_carterae.1